MSFKYRDNPLYYRAAREALRLEQSGEYDRAAKVWANVTNGAIVIHTQRLKSDPGGNLLS